MHGNVKEFCSDPYQDRLEGGVDPQGPSEGKSNNHGPLYVIRGGFFEAKPEQLRSAWREGTPRKHRATSLGFRVVLGKASKPPAAPAQAAPAAPEKPATTSVSPAASTAPPAAALAQVARK
jgi:hypothetical protein